jgi:hypothetical protein
MGLERIIHKAHDFSRSAVASGLLGLSAIGAIGAGSVPAYAQQKAKVVHQPSNVIYIPCKSQKDDGNIGEPLAVLGALLGTRNNRDAQNLGVMLSTAGAIESEKEIAREGKTQITINQGQSEQSQTKRYLPAPGCVWANPEIPDNYLVIERLAGFGFAANSFEDKSTDDELGSDQFKGVKKRFYDDEPLTLILCNPEKKGISKKRVNLYVFGPSGEKVDEISWEKNNRNYCLMRNYSSAEWLAEKGGYGEYIAKWLSGGGLSGIKGESIEFRILPSSDRE